MRNLFAVRGCTGFAHLIKSIKNYLSGFSSFTTIYGHVAIFRNAIKHRKHFSQIWEEAFFYPGPVLTPMKKGIYLRCEITNV